MKNILVAIIVLSCCIVNQIQAQNIYPEKFGNCDTSHFGMESDSLSVKVSKQDLIKVIKSALDEKGRKKVRGTLALQILVDSNGNSCLLSMKNDTNIKSSKWDLESTVKEKLKWSGSDYQMAALVQLTFTSSRVLVKRFGVNGTRGFHQIE